MSAAIPVHNPKADHHTFCRHRYEPVRHRCLALFYERYSSEA